MSELSLESAVETGMLLAWHAERQPDLAAVVSDHGGRTFAELEANVNRLARILRAAGIESGDAIAIALKNRPEFIEVMLTADRLGLRFTPINFHLKGDEIAYILDNCEARVFVADAALGDGVVEARDCSPALEVNLAVGGNLNGFGDYASVIDGEDAGRIDDPLRGSMMLYTSGTTGRPKGVHRDASAGDVPVWEDGIWNFRPGKAVNRWPHGYTYSYNPLSDPDEWAYTTTAERPAVVGRRRVGRIAITNADASASPHTDGAINEAYRAVSELLEDYGS